MSAELIVNEARVYATGLGAQWWAEFRGRFRHTERIRAITVSLGGDMVAVSCDDRDHARWLLEHAASMGVPRAAMKVRGAPSAPTH